MTKTSIQRGDDVTVTTGDYAGEFGTVICVHRDRLTIGRRNGYAFVVALAECERAERAQEAQRLAVD